MRGQLIAASKRTSHALYASPAIDQDAAALALRLFCRAEGPPLRRESSRLQSVKFAAPGRPL